MAKIALASLQSFNIITFLSPPIGYCKSYLDKIYETPKILLFKAITHYF